MKNFLYYFLYILAEVVSILKLTAWLVEKMLSWLQDAILSFRQNLSPHDNKSDPEGLKNKFLGFVSEKTQWLRLKWNSVFGGAKGKPNNDGLSAYEPTLDSVAAKEVSIPPKVEDNEQSEQVTQAESHSDIDAETSDDSSKVVNSEEFATKVANNS